MIREYEIFYCAYDCYFIVVLIGVLVKDYDAPVDKYIDLLNLLSEFSG